MSPLPLTDDEKWTRPMKDNWHGLIRARECCEYGDVAYFCVRYANYKVGRKKMCGQHAKIASGEDSSRF